ncbi:hypothetical protein VB713_19695 [Anabaena cylindrica UHCC 0172]|uniref:hypothetical protein n=1 Tax=Anabaena cylindrica TaxID=1165 RepID=UPI002B20C1E3|nr:hypothetical protein [Anabaena cylindrica]MEA5553169.1 hypothetical protein [Anabaena cylindrica UHCC 0172]
MINNLDKANILNILRKTKRDAGYKLYDLVRIITRQNILSQVVNEKEIRIVGLRRTGNHAIINWIRKQSTGKVMHLNNILVTENPYRFLYHHYPKDELKREAIGDFVKKNCLLYNYEDYSLEEVNNPKFERNHDLYLGKSAVRYDIIILRDPFNLLASRLQKNFITVKTPNETVMSLWIAYAKEFLGETNYLKNNKICVNYNQWFLDLNYRHQIASQLRLEFTDAGIEQVKNYGGGSSFDGKGLDGQANQMDVLNRYKMFENHADYQKLLNNKEVLEYSRRIFGDIGVVK